jgi:hypothetical protein
MIKREHRYGNLVFDQNAIVRAALRAYFEAIVKSSSFRACDYPGWTGDLRSGAFDNGDGCGNNDVVAWTEAGVVGLAYELGFGPVEYLGLSEDAVTGGPDDVRAAVPGLPPELEPAFEMAGGMLTVGWNGARQAGVGFWLHGDCAGGTFFDDPTSPGASRLAMWGLLRRGRLLCPLYRSSHPENTAILAECDRKEAPIHALMDAVVDRRLKGPTEFTTDEIATLFPTPPNMEPLLSAQRMLQKVGITWPGSPEIPPLPPPGLNPFTGKPFTEAQLARSLL